MSIHKLKTINPYFQDVWDGKKTFDLRLNDDGRDYKVDDVLILEEYDEKINVLTGRRIFAKVPYILSGKPWLSDGYVCMSLSVFRKNDVCNDD